MRNRKTIRRRESCAPKAPPEGERAIARGRTPEDVDLIQLIYVSEASPLLTQGDLDAIAAAGERNSHSDSLTGFLLYQLPRFYGVLEGPRRRLFARMERIATDPRHSRLRILREEPILRRRFQNWTFGRVPPPAQILGRDGISNDFIRTLSRKL